jgi:ADP-ribose pyrophosphatase YjhB (NUDIX family)
LEIAAEITAEHTNINKQNLLDTFNSHLGYATPKVDIRAAIVKNSEILLVQEKMDNRWAMPGGWADVGESPSKAIIRETKEESGLDIVPKRIIGIYNANIDGRPLEFFHAYKIVFLCDIVGGSLKTSEETLDVKYHSIDNLPDLPTSRTNQKHIIDIKRILEDSTVPTVFE